MDFLKLHVITSFVGSHFYKIHQNIFTFVFMLLNSKLSIIFNKVKGVIVSGKIFSGIGSKVYPKMS